MSLLVTGAAGFIGRRLLQSTNEKIIATDKVPMHHLRAGDAGFLWDITEERKARSLPSGIRACVHLAAIAAPRQAQSDPKLAWDTNVRGTFNVLSLAREFGIRKFVFMSSAHVYGISPKYLPTDESHPLALHDTYTTTKIAGEQLCRLFHSNYGMSTTILRLFNGYGVGQSPDYFIGKKLEQAATSRRVTIMNGGVTKDWIYVDDIVEAILLAIESEFVGPINIGTGTETDLHSLAARIAGAFDAELVLEEGDDGSPTRMCCDPRRAKSILGWEPLVTVEEGIERLVAARRGG